MKTWIVGNWKLHGDLAFIEEYLAAFCPIVEQVEVSDLCVGLCPPSVYVNSLVQQLEKYSVEDLSFTLQVGAQNVAAHSTGAFTGEVSAPMLRDCGAKFSLIGHSERRQFFGETNQVVAAKVLQSLESGLTPLLCVGETLTERDSDQTLKVIEAQLSTVCSKLSASQWEKMVIAYEPVWAIGTGLTATPEQAQEVHAFIRKAINGMQSESSVQVPLLYGGSVKPNNAKELLAQQDVNGLLVGGASLKPADFANIVSSAN